MLTVLKKRINVNENPLNWWSVLRGEFKVLSPIVRRFLSVPPGSVPSYKNKFLIMFDSNKNINNDVVIVLILHY